MVTASIGVMTTSPLVATTDLSEEQILERATACAREMRRAGAELLVLAYEWAVAHPVDRLDPKEAGKPGRERATILGGPGTPEVTEFAAAEFGARIERSTHHGRKLMGGALDIKIRLPLLWGRVQALEVRDSYALYVAERTRELSAEEAAWVDQEVAEAADGRIPWSHFEALVAGKVAAAAPKLAKEKEERAAAATYVRAIRPRAGDETHGIGTFVVRAPLPVIEALETAVNTLAHRLQEQLPEPAGPDDETPGIDELRVQAIALLASPKVTDQAPVDGETDLRDLLPAVELTVHLYGGAREVSPEHGELDRVARIEGWGPVTESWLRDVLGRYARFDVRPVLDLEGLAPVEAYEIPARHRRAVQQISPTETFPWGTTRSTGPTIQIDHVVPWDPHGPPGQTGTHNLTPLSTYHHRLKTHGRWQSTMPWPGVNLWRDPHGQVYLHDTSGTRGLDRLDQREALDQRVGDRPYTAIADWYEWAPMVVPDEGLVWDAA